MWPTIIWINNFTFKWSKVWQSCNLKNSQWYSPCFDCSISTTCSYVPSISLTYCEDIKIHAHVTYMQHVSMHVYHMQRNKQMRPVPTSPYTDTCTHACMHPRECTCAPPMIYWPSAFKNNSSELSQTRVRGNWMKPNHLMHFIQGKIENPLSRGVEKWDWSSCSRNNIYIQLIQPLFSSQQLIGHAFLWILEYLWIKNV